METSSPLRFDKENLAEIDPALSQIDAKPAVAVLLVEAARRSIDTSPAGVGAIVGGRFKGGDLRELVEPLRTHGRAVVVIGEAASLVREALGGVVPVVEARSMREAVEHAYEKAVPDGTVLLAPACASFDWFQDYAERGRVFKAEVVRLVRSGRE